MGYSVISELGMVVGENDQAQQRQKIKQFFQYFAAHVEEPVAIAASDSYSRTLQNHYLPGYFCLYRLYEICSIFCDP